MMRIFILLIGFPGVGKLTIARELQSLSSAKVIDNHWFNNPVLRLLDDDGTGHLPEGIWDYTGRIRQTVLDAIAEYTGPSANFIFTHAGRDGDQRSLRTYQQFDDAAQRCGAVLVPVRLLCDEDELARRISMPARRNDLKATDAQASRERSRRDKVFDPKHHNTLVLDVTSTPPPESAAAIWQHALKSLASSIETAPSNV